MFERMFRRPDRAPSPAQTAPPAAHAAALTASRRGWLSRLGAVFGPIDITADTWDELEGQLIAADVGAAAAAELSAALRARASQAGVRRADELPRLLRAVMVRALAAGDDGRAGAGVPAGDAGTPAADASPRPWVILIVGVNGSGKTTTVAKLARRHAAAGRSVVLVAADTFRAAAIEQLSEWAERAGAAIIKGTPGADPSAVVFDALRSQAVARADVVIIDTAGRLHTQHNLMAELAKVRSVIAREVSGAPHETLLVLDATTGQNGLAQARQFLSATQVTGLVLAKLDGSAKGGIAFQIRRELGLGIACIGTGEGIDDLAPFDAAAYVDGLIGFDGNSAR